MIGSLRMKLRKTAAVLTAAAMLGALSGCSEIKHTTPYLEQQAADFAVTATSEPEVTTTTEATTTVLTGPSFTSLSLEIPAVYVQDTELVYQAEDYELPMAFKETNTKTDYTGSGYVSGLTGELKNTFVFGVEVPSSQHYDISLVLCTDSGAECTMLLNDEELMDIAAEANEHFVSVTIPGVYMESGAHSISVSQKDGEMYLDCLVLRNNTSLIPDKEIEPALCSKNVSDETEMLMSFMCESYGKGIISGQHVSGADGGEIRRIVETTGKYPAVRFADMYDYSSNGGDGEVSSVTENCISWSEQGGITGLMWHWYAPIGEPGTLEMSEDFSLAEAVTDADIAAASPEELAVMQKAGAVSEECMALIQDIDTVSEELKMLCEKAVPVLWRPLHQAGSGLYWWESEGAECYLWLWELMFVRMTEYHGLDNLIWVWSGVDPEYLPEASRFDIASADIYLPEGETAGSSYEEFYALQEIAPDKLIAMSECSSLPDAAASFRDGSVWSFFGLWYEPYLTSEDNGFVTSEQLINTYNTAEVLTREDYISYCKQYKNGTRPAVTTTVTEQ